METAAERSHRLVAADPVRAADYQFLACEVARLRAQCREMLDARRRNLGKAQQVLDCFQEMINAYTVEDPETGIPFFLKDPDPLAVKIIHAAAGMQVLVEAWMAEDEMAYQAAQLHLGDN